MVSERHANFIVNDRRGTAADVRRLTEAVRDEVLAQAGVTLEPEIAFVGDWRGWPWPAEPAAPAEGAGPGEGLGPAKTVDPAEAGEP